MFSAERTIIHRVIERYVRTGSTVDEQVQVTVLEKDKTSAMDKVDQENRSIMLDEYQVDNVKVWSGYSTRSNTVFLSIITSR